MLVDWQDAWGVMSLLGAQGVTSASDGEGVVDASFGGRAIRWDRRRRAMAVYCRVR